MGQSSGSGTCSGRLSGHGVHHFRYSRAVDPELVLVCYKEVISPKAWNWIFVDYLDRVKGGMEGNGRRHDHKMLPPSSIFHSLFLFFLVERQRRSM